MGRCLHSLQKSISCTCSGLQANSSYLICIGCERSGIYLRITLLTKIVAESSLLVFPKSRTNVLLKCIEHEQIVDPRVTFIRAWAMLNADMEMVRHFGGTLLAAPAVDCGKGTRYEIDCCYQRVFVHRTRGDFRRQCWRRSGRTLVHLPDDFSFCGCYIVCTGSCF